MKSVLVFGGNQFVGIHICEKFLGKGYEVYVVNRGTRKNPVGTIHLRGDRNDEKSLKEILEGYEFDVVVDVSAYEPHQVEISLRLLKGRYRKYILISSASVYRSIGERPVSEDDETGGNPVWGEYSLNKYLCEEVLRGHSAGSGSAYTIFRPFYIYGPGNNLDRERYIFNRIMDGKPIFIPSGGAMVQFGYIGDLTGNIFRAAESDNFDNETYNLSGEEYVTFRELIEAAEKAAGRRAVVMEIDARSRGISPREWFPFRSENLWGDISKLKRAGGRVEYTLKEGLEETLRYLVENKLLGRYEAGALEREFAEEISEV